MRRREKSSGSASGEQEVTIWGDNWVFRGDVATGGLRGRGGEFGRGRSGRSRGRVALRIE